MKVPGGQVVQVAAAKLDAPVGPNCPAGHTVPVHVLRPVDVVYVPDRQFVHVAAPEVVDPSGPILPASHGTPQHVSTP